MILYDANRPGPNPVTVRLFVHERKGLQFDVETIDLEGLENRRRGTEAAQNAYRGHRILQPEAMRSNRLLADRGFNQLDEDLEGKTFIVGDDVTMADILLYGFMGAALPETPWLNPPQRPNVVAWFDRMAARESSQKMLTSLDGRFEN